VIAALAAIVLAQEAVTTAPRAPLPSQQVAPVQPSATPGDLSAAPPLPDGPLLAVAKSASGETFLVADTAAKVGDSADFWTYEAFIPAVQIKEGVLVVQGLTHHQADCTQKTDQAVASAGYDEGGTAVVALAAGPAAPLAPGGAYALIAAVLCQGTQPPRTDAIAGHAAALAAARETQAPAPQ
jgi:hypothetical protein